VVIREQPLHSEKERKSIVNMDRKNGKGDNGGSEYDAMVGGVKLLRADEDALPPRGFGFVLHLLHLVFRGAV